MNLATQLASQKVAREAARGWKRVWVSREELAQIQPLVRSGYLGTNHLVDMRRRTRYVVEGTPWVGDPEIARCYLDLIGHVRRKKMERPLVASPLFFRGPREGRWHYVDLTAAYWQLYHQAPVDLRIARIGASKWAIGSGTVQMPRCGEWKAEKGPRNALWGMLVASSVTRIVDGKVLRTPFSSPYQNLHLATWIQLQLHAVAADIYELFPDAVSWYTDGALVPYDQSDDLISYLGRRWGLEATVKEIGEGMVRGPGNYEWRPSRRPQVSRPSYNVAKSDITLVRDRRAWMAEKHG